MGKDYPAALKHQLKRLAALNLAPVSWSKVNLKRPTGDFELMVSLIVGYDDCKPLLDAFRKAKLKPEDPMHWADLLTSLLGVFSRRTRPVSIWSDKMKARLLRDCIAIGRKEPKLSILKICERLSSDRSKYPFAAENLQRQISRFGLTKQIKEAIQSKRIGRSPRSVRRVARSGAQKMQ